MDRLVIMKMKDIGPDVGYMVAAIAEIMQHYIAKALEYDENRKEGGRLE